LPDEILCSIISLLTVREAATTSVLSIKWRHLWKRTLNLNFDIRNNEFILWVDQLLQLYHGSKIETFKVNHPLSNEYVCQSDEWIQFAASRKVQNITLDLSKPKNVCKLYCFLCQLFAQGRCFSLKHLSLTNYNLSMLLGFGGFKSLLSFTLNLTILLLENLQVLLSSCIFLGWLSLTCCICPPRLKI
ncbi:hypothetical protein CFOL_v3_15182, partial [Cephalotus follicularis]